MSKKVILKFSTFDQAENCMGRSYTRPGWGGGCANANACRVKRASLKKRAAARETAEQQRNQILTSAAKHAFAAIAATIYSLAAIAAAAYQRPQGWFPATPSKAMKQMTLFDPFKSPLPSPQQRVLQTSDITQALLWFRGWLGAQKEWLPNRRQEFYNQPQKDGLHTGAVGAAAVLRCVHVE